MTYETPTIKGTLFEDKTFSFPVRIYYEDTDAGGIVYYANYLKYAERARTEFLRHLGINQEEMLKNQGQGFVVRNCMESRFHSKRFIISVFHTAVDRNVRS